MTARDLLAARLDRWGAPAAVALVIGRGSPKSPPGLGWFVLRLGRDESGVDHDPR